MALGVLIICLSGLINLVLLPIANLLSNRVSELHDARFRLARLKAIDARPSPEAGDPVPPGLYISASSREIASDALAAAISGAASRNQIQISNVAIMPARPNDQQALSISFSAAGGEIEMLSFLNELEQGSPPIRFSAWSLGRPASAPAPSSPDQPAQLVFTGTATAIWDNQK